MVWFGNLTIQVKSKLARLLKIAMKTIGRKEYLSLESLYEQLVLREAHQILAKLCFINKVREEHDQINN